MQEYISRNIDKELIAWKDDSMRKPLLLRGARQVGKSSAVRHFGKEFKYFAEVNFDWKSCATNHASNARRCFTGRRQAIALPKSTILRFTTSRDIESTCIFKSTSCFNLSTSLS